MKGKTEARVIIAPKVFEQCYAMLESAKSEESYIDEALKLPIWDKSNVSREGRDEWLRNIYLAYNRDLKEIIELSGMSIASFYRYFGIPRRTLQDWLYGKNVPPKYTLFMIQEILGLLTRF